MNRISVEWLEFMVPLPDRNLGGGRYQIEHLAL
jgi:hypothetical protein